MDAGGVISDVVLGLLYHLVTVHSLWHAPIYAWLLLVSAWARRLAILWAVLPLIAIGMVEKVAFNTTYFANMIGNRFAGGPGGDNRRRQVGDRSYDPSHAGQLSA